VRILIRDLAVQLFNGTYVLLAVFFICFGTMRFALDWWTRPPTNRPTPFPANMLSDPSRIS
jgi:hypothetical protein